MANGRLHWQSPDTAWHWHHWGNQPLHLARLDGNVGNDFVWTDD